MGLLAVALALGLSPVLFEFARHLREEPSALYVLACASVLAFAVRGELAAGRREAPALARGLPWIATAVVLELFCYAGGIERFARPALPLALIGWLRASGLARLPLASLAFWLVPVPKSLSEFGEFGFHYLWHDLASPFASSAADALVLDHWDSGLRPAAIAAAFGWWRATHAGRRPWNEALRLGAVGFASQGLALAFALAAAALGAVGEARAFLTHGAWVSTTALLFLRYAPRGIRGAQRGA